MSLILLGSGLLPAASHAKNRYVPYPEVTNPSEGILWPKGQALPVFSTPAPVMDAILVQDLSKDELISFSALQGLVNRKQPRILLQNARSEEGVDTWADTAGLKRRKLYEQKNKYKLAAKYAEEVAGVVLYDPEISPHYRNLAGTVGGIHRAMPVTAEVHENLKKNGADLKVVVDLTKLEWTTPIEIYQHLYETWWEKCDRRLLVSAKPHDEKGGGDYHHTRDIAAAGGAAVVWLNTLVPEEKEVLRKFFGDMKAGEAVVLGWYVTERSGITTASEFGIGTLPADFYVSGSVYAGTDHRIRIPKVPKKPELENKAYVALFVSDGDNIQYTQHAMRRIWDANASIRGKIPLNWTIAPGLVDIGPVILNYFYTTATPNDCFVTGPSGMGYAMPFNTLTEPGAPVGEYLRDPERMDGYARLTETYLQRSGLRVVTIWDDATPMQRKSYEAHCRNLYGATVQNFRDVRSVAGSVENERVRFDKLVIPYAGSYEHIRGSLDREIRRWNGKSPLFLAYQVDIWGELKPDKLVALQEDLAKAFPDKVELVRADHYFNLYNEANGLPFNLCLSAGTSARAGGSSESLEAVIDGTPETMWTAAEKGTGWLGLDFGSSHRIHRYVIRHAGENGMSRELNTRDYMVQASLDGKSWKTVDVFKGNTENVTDVEFNPVDARYVKITVANGGADKTARIAEVEVYGSR